MAKKKKTVLVLGAGASHGYGFPVGSGLRREILALRDNSRVSEVLEFGQTTIRNFVDAFKMAQSYSIDAFLARRQELSKVGRAAIAYVLLRCEGKADLFNEEQADHWYQYLLSELVADDWESFDPSWLSIVTFNYDRSLETFLCRSMQEIYSKTAEEVWERLSKLRIVHVYGSIGEAQPCPTHVPFGGIADDVFDLAVKASASRLVVIPEGRDDAPSVAMAQELTNEAKRVCFLGFGFDEVNVRRLGAIDNFVNSPGRLPKKVVATCLGMTPAEANRAAVRVCGVTTDHYALRDAFRAVNCISLLRETLILD
mgnify:CR=1 FL=1